MLSWVVRKLNYAEVGCKDINYTELDCAENALC